MPERDDVNDGAAGGDRRRDEDLPPPPPSRVRDRAFWVGLFVIVGVGSVLIALFTLTDAALFRGRYLVSTVVPNAGGIRKGDPVQMRGVNIGRVMQFRIVAEGVEIRLEIEGEYGIPEDSRVVLHSLGVLQGMVADIAPGTSKKMVGNGDALAGDTEAAGLAAMEGLAGDAKKVLDRAQALLSQEMVGNVHASSAEARQLLKELSAMAVHQRKELAEVSLSLKRSTSGLERITGGLEKATTGPELERSVKRIDTLTARLDETTATLDRSSRSLETVLSRIEKGEGTLGKLTRDDALYANLNEAALNLSRLAEDVRRQPKRYVNLSLF